MIADNAIYVDGRRAAQQPSSLQETYEALRQLDDGVAWIDETSPKNARHIAGVTLTEI
jgi:hypothetical protein